MFSSSDFANAQPPSPPGKASLQNLIKITSGGSCYSRHFV